MNIKLECSSVNISADSRYKVVVELDNVSKSDILNNFDANDAIEHFGQEEILDLTDVEFIKTYFGLTEIE